jgi:maltose alpha-D-glucosyltransferase/alpha-amylase
MFPEELYSRNRFPMIQESRYHFTMGSYAYFWFVLRNTEGAGELRAESLKLRLREGQPWWEVLEGKGGERLCSQVLPHYLQRVFWFCGKGRGISQISILDCCQLKQGEQIFLLVFIQVTYTAGDPEIYQLPMTWLSSERIQLLSESHPLATITSLSLGEVDGLLCDAVYFEEFRELLFTVISNRGKITAINGSHLVGLRGEGVSKSSPPRSELFPSRVTAIEQNNTSILYGERLVLKLYR